MKKLLALALAMAMALPLSVGAFAAGKPHYDNSNVDNLVAFITEGKRLSIGGLAKDADNVSVAMGDTVRSDEDFYVTMEPLASNPSFADKDLFKVSFKKEENGDRLRYALITEKDFKDGKGRSVAFRFILKDAYDDGEYRVRGTATFKAQKDMALLLKAGSTPTKPLFDFVEATPELLAADKYYAILDKGTKMDIPIQFFVTNEAQNADYDATAGEGGIIVKPQKNDGNEITWQNANDTLAKIAFEADDDAAKLYPKLSTKWYGIAPYTPVFADQDAFVYNFMASPAIGSTSRATLTIYNPYYDADEEEFTVAPENVLIFQVVDGELKNVTASFKAEEDADGEQVFITKTRQLGTYILAERIPTAMAQAAAEAAPAQEAIPAAELVPAQTAAAPAALVLPSYAK